MTKEASGDATIGEAYAAVAEGAKALITAWSTRAAPEQLAEVESILNAGGRLQVDVRFGRDGAGLTVRGLVVNPPGSATPGFELFELPAEFADTPGESDTGSSSVRH